MDWTASIAMYPRRVGGEWDWWGSSLFIITPIKVFWGSSACGVLGKCYTDEGGRWGAHEKAEIGPLVEEVAVYIDAVGFREVF